MKKGITWGSAIFALAGFLTTPAVAAQQPVRSDYLLRFGQCLLGIVVLFLPLLIEKRLHVAIPGRLYIVYLLFLYAALYLGEVQRFYDKVPGWDKILHGLTGLALGVLVMSVVGYVSLRRGSTWLEKIALRHVGEAAATRRGRRPDARRRSGRTGRGRQARG